MQAFCKQREDKPALAEEEADTSTAGLGVFAFRTTSGRKVFCWIWILFPRSSQDHGA